MTDKLRRLGEMDLTEIRFRAGQKLRNARESWMLCANATAAAQEPWWRAWDPERVSPADFRAALTAGRAEDCARLLPVYLSARSAPRFFARPFFPQEQDWESLRALYLQRFPGRREEILAEAERLRQHRFRIFAYPEAAADASIPWRRDLLHGTESDGAHWSRIPYLDFPRVGDSKIVWEPSRHQHFVTLGQAWLFSGDASYAEEAFAQFDHWSSANPYPRGIHWASSLEAAFRAWSWLWTIHLLSGPLGRDATTSERLGSITAGLAQHAHHMAANLSTYFSPNTHLLGEGFGLYVIGLMLPELRGASEWRAQGRCILEEQMQAQVHPDGAHAEQSSCYHRYAADFFLCAAILAEGAGEPFPRAYRERLERMTEFSVHSAWPSGRQPMTGDADGGQLLSFSPRRPNEHRGLLSTAAVYFSRGDLAGASGGLREETVWLLGAEAVARFEALVPAEPAHTSRIFRDCGAVVQRSDWTPEAHFLRLDAGPQGMPPCAHGHADALSILCAANGIEWIVDPGTYVYTSAPPWRDFFRSTRAHGTLTVDGRDQADAADCFKWRNLPAITLERAAVLDGFDAAVASHSGFTRLPGVGIHRRAVFFAKPDFWLIADTVEGSGSHRLAAHFPFAPGVQLTTAQGRALAEKDGARLLWACSDPRWTLRVAAGSESPIEGWFSEDYGARTPAPVLVAETSAELPATVFWLVWPSSPERAELKIFASSRAAGLRAGVLSPRSNTFCSFRAAEGAPVQDGLWSDAEIAFLRQDASGRVTRLALAAGCCADFRGEALLRAESWLDALEASIAGDMLDMQVRPLRRLRLRWPGVARMRVNNREIATKRRGDWLEIPGET